MGGSGTDQRIGKTLLGNKSVMRSRLTAGLVSSIVMEGRRLCYGFGRFGKVSLRDLDNTGHIE